MRLVRVYARAQYWVLLSPPLRLLPGRRNTEAETRLACGREWALITPCNPRGKRAASLRNRAALRRLRRQLRRLRLRTFPAANRDPDSRWPDEPGFFLPDVKREQALGLGRQFRQNAILAARTGKRAQLLWLC